MMEPIESQPIFKVEDLNQLIKLYAYEIQQRFQQISKVQYQMQSSQNQNSDIGQYLVEKYRAYTTSHPVQVKYVQKLVQRIIQIFSFFKTRSKHQHLLGIFQEKINTTFQGYLSKRPLDVGDVFSYTVQMVKPGFFTKIQPSYERRRLFTRVLSKENPKVPITIPKPRRTVSVANNSHSLAKVPTAKSCQNPKMTHQEAFSKNYSILGIDRNYLIRTVEHTNNVKREMIQRNDAISKQIRNYSKKLKTESDQGKQSCSSQVNILSDLNNQNRSFIRKGINAPSLNNWVNRKRRIATANRNRNNQNTWCT